MSLPMEKYFNMLYRPRLCSHIQCELIIQVVSQTIQQIVIGKLCFSFYLYTFMGQSLTHFNKYLLIGYKGPVTVQKH